MPCNHDCEEGRQCPARTRRVKAGAPPPDDDLPIQYWYNDDDGEPSDSPDFFAIACVIAIVSVMFTVIALGWSR